MSSHPDTGEDKFESVSSKLATSRLTMDFIPAKEKLQSNLRNSQLNHTIYTYLIIYKTILSYID